jgi:TrkA domain protein
MSDEPSGRALQSTHLPGVGDRHEFGTEDGDTLGVVRHRDGDRELIVFSHEDRDACRLSLRLRGEDARRLAALLGEGSVSSDG